MTVRPFAKRREGKCVPSFRDLLFSTAVISICLSSASVAYAETLNGALAKAYQNNATINSARAGVRVADEGVAIAKSGYRPTVNGRLSWEYSSTRAQGFQSGLFTGTRYVEESLSTSTGAVSITVNQTLFDGFQTTNNVRAAESQVYAERENLRNSTQTVLFDGVQAFMDVIRNRSIADLRARNIEFLSEQLRAAKVRLEVGEGTRTDVAQAEASLAGARAQLNEAKAQVASSEAVYRQIVGEGPGQLQKPKPVSSAPTNFDKALSVASVSHPAIQATQYAADALAFNVKSVEGQLLPSLAATAQVSKQDTNRSGNRAGDQSDTAGIGLTLNVPIYQGGRTSAQIRQAKERLGQGQIEIDVIRDRVRAAVASSTSQYLASVASVEANRQLVSAARLALDGVVEERRVGQRTTLDVLNAQADLINAQINQVNAEADSVVASYAILSAIGQLEPKRLGLGVREHKPQEHYKAVKDKWFGLRTPDGR